MPTRATLASPVYPVETGHMLRPRLKRSVATRWHQIITLPRHRESGLQCSRCRVVVTAAHNSGEGSPPVMSDRDAAVPFDAATRW